MMAKLREIFSFSTTQTEQKKNSPFNVELINCPLREMMCKVHHSNINKSFIELEKYRIKSDIENSIETLRIAFSMTDDLMNKPCNNCALHFRSVIFESLEQIHDEMGKKSKGFFRKKYYKSMFLKADTVLKEIENEGVRYTNQIAMLKKRFLGNHLN